MTQKGILVVVSGFSGVGKGTIMKRLTEKYDRYALSVSATTRRPRAGEEHGREYFFYTEEKFRQMIENDELIEYAMYCDHFYGTPRRYVEEQLESGRDVILEIEIQGALKIHGMFPDALLLFVMPPSAAALRERLTGRETEQADAIDARLRRAAEEADGIENYDYMLVNDQVETCVDEMHNLISCQHQRVARNLEFINKVRNDIKAF